MYVQTFITFNCLLFQIIDAPFPKEVEDKEENMELPNSHTIVEAD